MPLPFSLFSGVGRHAARNTARWCVAAAVLLPSWLLAQDPIPSLQFANPTILNPAFTGLIEGTAAVSFSHRIRSGTDDVRNQVSIGELHLPLRYKWFTGGTGLTLINDNYAGITRNSATVNLAWEAPLGRRVRYYNLRAGAQAGIIQSSVQDPLFVFEDMYNATLGEFSGRTNESIAGLSSPVRLDLNVGLLFYRTQKIKGNPEFNYFAGVSFFHVNQPNMGLLPSDNVQRSIRSVYMAGVKYRTRGSLDVNFHINAQEQNNSMLGTYTLFARMVLFERGVIHGAELASVTLGSSVRQQLNTVNIDGTTQRQTGLESFVPFFSFDYGRSFGFGIAYDAIISEANALGNSGGGIQFSARYTIGANKHTGNALPFPSF